MTGRSAVCCSAGDGLLRRLLLRGWRAAPQVVAPRVAGCSAGCCFAGGGPLRRLLLRGVAGCNVRSIFTLIVIFLAQPALGSQASVPGCFFCANNRCLLAFSFWRPAELLLRICCTATASAHLLHRSVFCASVASQRLLCICCIAASSAERQALPLRSIPPAAPPAGNIFPMALRRSAPASNKPHLAEKISGLASNLAHLGRIC